MDAYDWWEVAIDGLLNTGTFFVRISPSGGRPPFDALLVGRDKEAKRWNTLLVRRADKNQELIGSPSDPPESVVVDKIHIY